MIKEIPSPQSNIEYQYICIICGNQGLEYGGGSVEGTIKLFEAKGWIYKGKDLGYPYKLYFEYPKTDFDLSHFAMYQDMGNML